MSEKIQIADNIEEEILETLALDGEEKADLDEYFEENLINLDTDNLKECLIDDVDFQKGINSVSEICGAISALVSVGINPNVAMQYYAEREAGRSMTDMQINMTNINAEAQIECSKFSNISVQRNVL